jgi:hypothetical protein
MFKVQCSRSNELNVEPGTWNVEHPLCSSLLQARRELSRVAAAKVEAY